MSPDGAYRLEDLLALASEELLGFLAGTLDCRPTLSDVRDAILSQNGQAQVVLDSLDEQELETLHGLSSVRPIPSPDLDAMSEPMKTLVDRGFALVLTLQDEPRIYVPLEIQRALDEQRAQMDPDVRLLLLKTDEEKLLRLEGIFGAGEGEDESTSHPLERVCRLAEAMESRTTLREIHKNLPATAREVLGWTCEHGGPIRVEELEKLTQDAADFHDERADVAVGQLLRFGLLMSHDIAQTGEVYLVPRSLRPAILGFIVQDLGDLAQTHYEDLLASGHLSFPDEGPHGWGGNSQRSFRQVIINWISGYSEEMTTEYGVAVGMQMIDADHFRAGAFASLLLDLSSETAFTRQALRYWLAIIDDPWTLDLVSTLGGDPDRLVDHFSRDPEQIETSDVELWFGHLFQLRAQLLLALSLLPPGRWYSVSSLARLFHVLSSRATVSNLSPPSLSARFPFDALPDYGVVIARTDRLELIQSWLANWLVEFIAVLGAAQLDSTGTFFRIHPDSFCVFRDTDLWFQRVWDDFSRIVGEDLDIWMPIPNDAGPRISGVAEFRMAGLNRIVVDERVHLFDLIRLSTWAIPVAEPAGFGFELTAQTVTNSLERGVDGEDFLLWLAVRLHGEISPGLRSLFPYSSTPADGTVEQWRLAAGLRVEELLQSLESWGTAPPGRLLEEIRSWGSAAEQPLVGHLQSLLGEGRVADPLAQHLCILLGELGAQSAVPFLVAIIRGGQTELLQHAAAAACMRIGQASLEDLTAIVLGKTTPQERRLIAAMGLTGLATLHPHVYPQVTDTLIRAIEATTFDSELQTRLTLELCRTGHHKAEELVEQLQADENWNSAVWQPEDALWLVRISPCVWGSLLFSVPLPMLYLVSEEADELARESGVRDLLKTAGLSTDAVLYGRPRTHHEEE